MNLSEQVYYFLRDQGFVIVSTIDPNGRIHCAAKGLVGLSREGQVFIIDLYSNRTYENLKKNTTISITAIDEHRFMGFTLQGKGKIVPRKEIKTHIYEEWENKIIKRISNRVIKGVQAGVKSKKHFEVDLPRHPKYLIEVDVEEIIDLAKSKRKQKRKD